MGEEKVGEEKVGEERESGRPAIGPVGGAIEEPMSHAEALEINAVDRYLLGQLPAAEAHRFEEHYLSCAECLEELKVTETLMDGMRQTAAQDVAVVSLSFWARWRRRAWFGVAALLFLLPSLFFYREWHQTQDRLDQALSSPKAGPTYLPLSPTRDSQAPSSHIVRLDAKSEWVLLSLELSPPISPTYDIALRRGTEVLWRSQPTEPNAFDALVVQLPTSMLETGDYFLETTSSSNQRARFIFRALPVK